MPTVIAVPSKCGTCSGPIYDNRGPTKRNPKAPDFKCKNKSCEWVAWPPRKGEVYADQVIAQTIQRGPAAPPVDMDKEYGFDIPGQFQLPGKDAPNAPMPVVNLDKGVASLDALFDLHGACWGYTARLTKEESVRAAIAATLLIAAQKAGIT